MNINNCKFYLQNNGYPDLADELSPNGIGAEFFELEQKRIPINEDEFFQWVFTENRGNAMIDMLESKFSSFEILEHYNNSWKLKVSRDNYSIGYLFGLMEDVKA